MKHYIKKGIISLLITVMIAPFLTVNSHLNAQASTFSLPGARSAFAFDFDTGESLYKKNANQPMRIASLSKLMTLYLTIKKVQATRNGWNKVVNISGTGLRKLSYNVNDGGGFKFIPGHKYTVRQLYKAALILSSNNAAIALGRWTAGSNRKFIQLMNRQAKKWKLRASFVSSSGLDNSDLAHYGLRVKGSYYAGNMVSAKSVGMIAEHLLDEYPQITKDSKIKTTYVDGQKLYNYNEMLKNRKYYIPSLYVDGLKTGYTPTAGYCFVGSSKKPGHDRLITVILNDNHDFKDTGILMKHIYKTNDLSDDGDE